MQALTKPDICAGHPHTEIAFGDGLRSSSCLDLRPSGRHFCRGCYPSSDQHDQATGPVTLWRQYLMQGTSSQVHPTLDEKKLLL